MRHRISGIMGSTLAATSMVADGIKIKSPERGAISKSKRMSIDEAMAATGTNSPKAALDKLKRLNGNYRYLPHTGAKQKAKAERARIKALKKSVGL